MPALPPLLILLAALPLLALAQGCGKTSPYPLGRSASSSIVTTPDGMNRTYNIYVPSGYNINTATPLMLFFHGGGGTGALYESRYGMDDQAESLKFITVYPDGYQNTWNGGTCCGAARNANIDDVNFVSQLIDQLTNQLCVDPGRVFAIGHSNGAILSQRLACQLSNKIVAIAPVEGTLNFSPCQPTNKVAIYEIHGTADPNVPYDGGLGCGPTVIPFNSVNYTLGTWLSLNGCGATFTSSYTLNDTTCYTYAQGCVAPVTLCVVLDGNHPWPGGPGGFNVTGDCLGGHVGYFPATQEIAKYMMSVTRTSGSTLTGSLPTNPPTTATTGATGSPATTAATGSPATTNGGGATAASAALSVNVLLVAFVALLAVSALF